MTQDTSDILTNPASAGEDNTTQQDETIPSASSHDEVDELKAQIAQLREQIARSQADYSNLVRRSREEQSQISEWTENKTILKFLPILDNLERSLEHIPTELQSHTWIEGIQSIVKSMQKIITDFGISRMECIGAEVNPDLHDVISQIPHESTAIQAEVEKGYTRSEKALRHAKVIVGDGSQNNHA